MLSERLPWCIERSFTFPASSSAAAAPHQLLLATPFNRALPLCQPRKCRQAAQSLPPGFSPPPAHRPRAADAGYARGDTANSRHGRRAGSPPRKPVPVARAGLSRRCPRRGGNAKCARIGWESHRRSPSRLRRVVAGRSLAASRYLPNAICARSSILASISVSFIAGQYSTLVPGKATGSAEEAALPSRIGPFDPDQCAFEETAVPFWDESFVISRKQGLG